MYIFLHCFSFWADTLTGEFEKHLRDLPRSLNQGQEQVLLDEDIKNTCLLIFVYDKYVKRKLLELLHNPMYCGFPKDHFGTENTPILEENLRKELNTIDDVENRFLIKNRLNTSFWNHKLIISVILTTSSGKLSHNLIKTLESFRKFQPYCLSKEDFEKGLSVLKDFMTETKSGDVSAIDELKDKEVYVDIEVDANIMSHLGILKAIIEQLHQKETNSIKKKATGDFLQAVTKYGNTCFIIASFVIVGVFNKEITFLKITLCKLIVKWQSNRHPTKLFTFTYIARILKKSDHWVLILLCLKLYFFRFRTIGCI